jgi:hypothetical protein
VQYLSSNPSTTLKEEKEREKKRERKREKGNE